jgi:pimeloyl-ACP methyl ester carboxylesterase
MSVTHRIAIVLIAFLVAGSTPVGRSLGAAGATTTPDPTRRSFSVSSGSTSYAFDYWSNADIGVVEGGVRRVVVVVHGDSRNADDYSRYAASAAQAARVMSSTVVVAPRFMADADDPGADHLYWTTDSWKDGGESEVAGRSWTMSSFRVMTALLTALRDDYPAARIVLAGHSAGGQFVQRYAASNAPRVADAYVLMNPGSYLYLNGRRWADGRLRVLNSKEVDACSRYNRYKYGLRARPMSSFSTSRATVVSTYLAAPVTYLLGKADTTRDSDLDTGCEADWQGANRLQRGTRFFRTLRAMAGADLRHRLVTVPRVAHEGGSMIRSAQAARLLFAVGPADAATARLLGVRTAPSPGVR